MFSPPDLALVGPHLVLFLQDLGPDGEESHVTEDHAVAEEGEDVLPGIEQLLGDGGGQADDGVVPLLLVLQQLPHPLDLQSPSQQG